MVERNDSRIEYHGNGIINYANQIIPAKLMGFSTIKETVIICKLQFFSYSMNQHIQHTCDAQKYMP
jgi:hypothetical protein